MKIEHVPDDKLYNRRKLAYYSAINFLVWGYVILIARCMGFVETDDVVAFLAFPTTISVAFGGAYLWAANKADKA
jgi:hypothetical protein